MFGGNRWNNNTNAWNQRSFSTMYRCYSTSMLPGNQRSEVEYGGKIILPATALNKLMQNNAVSPMLFKLTNPANNRISHCGVLEFIAAEGQVNMPYWMMRNLNLEEGAMVRVDTAVLQVATFAKFQAQSMEFMEVVDPKTVLEKALRNFACLTKGDVIALEYNSQTYEMRVVETQPRNAVAVIALPGTDLDMTVDFEDPVGFHNPDRPHGPNGPKQPDQEEEEEVTPFQGTGTRLGGKTGKTKPGDVPKTKVPKKPLQRGRPDYNYTFGKLRFFPTEKRETKYVDKKTNPAEAVRSSGQTLKKRSEE